MFIQELMGMIYNYHTHKERLGHETVQDYEKWRRHGVGLLELLKRVDTACLPSHLLLSVWTVGVTVIPAVATWG